MHRSVFHVLNIYKRRRRFAIVLFSLSAIACLSNIAFLLSYLISSETMDCSSLDEDSESAVGSMSKVTCKPAVARLTADHGTKIEIQIDFKKSAYQEPRASRSVKIGASSARNVPVSDYDLEAPRQPNLTEISEGRKKVDDLSGTSLVFSDSMPLSGPSLRLSAGHAGAAGVGQSFAMSDGRAGVTEIVSESNGSGNESDVAREARDSFSERMRNVLVFNPLPKTGSTSLERVLYPLKVHDRNNFRIFHSHVYSRPDLLNDTVEAAIVDWIVRHARDPYGEPRKLCFIRHIQFLDFEAYGHQAPIYVSSVRDPVERAISEFYFLRVKKRLFYWKERMGEEVFQQVPKPPAWLNDTVDDCIARSPNFRCDPDEFLRRGRRSGLVAYFCGQKPYCSVPNDKRAMRRAMDNIARYFPVVAVLELLEKSLVVMEDLVPDFWSGAVESYAEVGQNSKVYKMRQRKQLEAPAPSIVNRAGELKNERKGMFGHFNVNFRKPSTSDKSKAILRNLLRADVELYAFLKQRLDGQYKEIMRIRLRQSFQNPSESSGHQQNQRPWSDDDRGPRVENGSQIDPSSDNAENGTKLPLNDDDELGNVGIIRKNTRVDRMYPPAVFDEYSSRLEDVDGEIDLDDNIGYSANARSFNDDESY